MILQTRAVRNVKRVLKVRALKAKGRNLRHVVSDEAILAHPNPCTVVASLRRFQYTYNVDCHRWESPHEA